MTFGKKEHQDDALGVRPKDRDTADHATNASSTSTAPRVGDDRPGNEAQTVELAQKSSASSLVI